MLKRIAFLFFFPLFAAAFQPAASQVQSASAVFEHLTTANGLSSNEVNCLFQDSRGFLWIGTNNGLNRYDGVDFVQYFHTTNTNSIAGNRVYSIREDKQHRLWMGTDGGVSRFEVEKNKFTNYLNTPADIEKLKSSFFNVAIDSDGHLWVSSSFHLSCLDEASNQFQHYKIDNGQSLPITRNHNIRSAFEDSKKRLWIPTTYGVKLFNRDTKQFTSFHFPEKEKALPENLITAIKETSGQKIIASTWGAGILIFNETLQKFEPLSFYEGPLPRRNLINIVLDFLQVKDKLYCASSEGLLVLNETDLKPGIAKQFAQYTHTENNSQGLNSKFCSNLLMDKTGTLWIGTKGINKIDPLKQQFSNTVLLDNKIPLSISGIGILSNNRLLLGAQDGFLYADSTLKPLGLAPKLKSEFGPQIWDVYAGKTYCWLGTTNGLIQTSKDGQFVKQYIHQKGNPASISGERIWKVYEDSRGLVWLGSVRRGISILNPADGSIKNYFALKGEENSLFNCYINEFFEDQHGNVWFPSREDKLYCYQRTTQSFSILQINLATGEKLLNTPHIVRMLPNGQLILASQRGLLQFDANTQKAELIAFHADMTVIKHAIATADSHYWMVTSNGLLHYNTSTRHFKRYTTLNGLTVDEDIDVIKQMPDGNMLLAGLGFVSVFNPAELGNNRNVPPVRITHVLANSKDSLFAHETYSLPYLSGIRFDFASLNFSNAEQNMYKYRLKGIDTIWSQPMQQRSVSYAQLPPGRYTFEVMGSNGDGVWNETPATFSFSIERPFYKAWWFYALVALTATGLIYAFYRYRLRQALELEKMRTRIATDLHDDIGATLSSISMYSESLKGMVKDTFPHLEPVLDKMGENSREMVTGMSDIVWAINPQNDTGEKLVGRMESYATDMCAVKNIRLHFAADEKLSAVQLPLEQRKNIYLIFKEAVNNAVKYSGAKHIDISIGLQGKQITLTVKDDGKGFDEETVKKGNGLSNLRLRADEVKGKLEIISVPEKGTTIRLLI